MIRTIDQIRTTRNSSHYKKVKISGPENVPLEVTPQTECKVPWNFEADLRNSSSLATEESTHKPETNQPSTEDNMIGNSNQPESINQQCGKADDLEENLFGQKTTSCIKGNMRKLIRIKLSIDILIELIDNLFI